MPETILVYPKLVSLTEMGIPALRPFGDLTTPRRLVEDPMRLIGARPYVAGDSYRHIHWKATAHRSDLQTKVFEPSAARPVAVFVNVNTSRYLIEGLDYELREYAISASGLHRALGIAKADSPPACTPTPSCSRAACACAFPRACIRTSSWKSWKSLARITGYGRWPMSALVAEESRRLPYGTAVVVVSAPS